MSLVFSPVRAAAIVLPLLSSGLGERLGFSPRLFAAQPRDLASLLGDRRRAGWLLAARVSEDAVRLAVGLISIAFVAYMLVRDRLGARRWRSRRPERDLVGSLSGFTSFISHAGSPPFQVYVMPQYLEPRIFAGTSTIFFAAVNLSKLPGNFLLGQLNPANLVVSAWPVPVAVLSTFAGVCLFGGWPRTGSTPSFSR